MQGHSVMGTLAGISLASFRNSWRSKSMHISNLQGRLSCATEYNTCSGRNGSKPVTVLSGLHIIISVTPDSMPIRWCCSLPHPISKGPMHRGVKQPAEGRLAGGVGSRVRTQAVWLQSLPFLSLKVMLPPSENGNLSYVGSNVSFTLFFFIWQEHKPSLWRALALY